MMEDYIISWIMKLNDQIPLNESQLGDCLKYLKENMEVTILSYKMEIYLQ